jgi:hypothetical protein
MHIANYHFICFEVRISLLNMSKEGGGERKRERDGVEGGTERQDTHSYNRGRGQKISALKVPGRARSSFW